ncbi:MAG: hypothetical protein IPN01_38470 [Deltaproteobacteria bacterium]|nr:hypothetical protein [Deltaproteobacteria bacterium]
MAADAVRWGSADVVAAVILAVFAPLVTLWPIGADALLSAPGQEAPEHLAGLWLAAQTGDWLVVETGLLAWPEGERFVLIDPLNLLIFRPLAAWPILAFNAVLWAGCAIGGLAGALLSREGGGRLWVGALLGATAGPLGAMAAEGQTEAFTLPWAALQLVALLAFVRLGGLGRGILAALSLAACFYGGPYTGIFAALGAGAVGLWWLKRRPTVLAVGLLALILAAPMAWATLTQRDEGLPGSASRAQIPEPETDPEGFRGGLAHGADLTDAWAPLALTGAAPSVGHSVYVGLGLWILALVGLVRAPRLWPWMFGAAVFTALAWGPWLLWRGEVLRLGEARLRGPVGALMGVFPPAQRLNRWYRAGVVAGFLLLPLAAAGLNRRGRLPLELLTPLLAADALWGGPARWPRAEIAPRLAVEAQAWEGPIVEVPAVTTASRAQAPGGENLLLLPLHGQPISSSFLGLQPPIAQRPDYITLRDRVRRGADPAPALLGLRDQGFKTLWWSTEHSPLSAEAREAISASLGPPIHQAGGVLVWSLSPR